MLRALDYSVAGRSRLLLNSDAGGSCQVHEPSLPYIGLLIYVHIHG
jgi:hypothetical protein